MGNLILKRVSQVAVCCTLLSCGGGGTDATSSSSELTSTDSTPPSITLLGDTAISVERGRVYNDQGASSDTGETVVVDASLLDTSVVGSYTVTYNVVDAAGNEAAEVTRTVNVVDTIAPVISLTGDSQVSVIRGSPFIDQGATSDTGEVVIVDASSVDTSTVGTYIATYNAADESGNKAVEVVRSINVQPAVLSVFQNGNIGESWNPVFNAFDQANNWQTCSDDGGASCPSISWQMASDTERGDILEIRHGSSGDMAGFFLKTDTPLDMSDYAGGKLKFDVKVVSGNADITMKVDCMFPCTSGDQRIGRSGVGEWETIEVGVNSLVGNGRLDLSRIDTGIVIWATNTQDTTFLLDNVYWEESPTGATTETGLPSPTISWENPNLGGAFSSESYPGYSLVWSDEFSGTELNEVDWNYEIGTGNNGWGNNELQYYRRENTSLQDGLLIIEAREENVFGSQYTSSRITTQNKKSFRYGRIDIRAATPFGKGLWPALWMLGDSFSSVGWPKSGEIDIMEMTGGSGGESIVVGTAHWNRGGGAAAYSPTSNASNNGGPTNEYRLPGGESLAASFHVFSLVWTRDSIKWLIDGFQFNEMAIDNSADLSPFRGGFFFIMNVAVGGNFPGAPDQTTQFPQRMLVDYIRVFEAQ